MNVKNKKGVTLTVLVITIIVMIILFGITFTTSTELLKNTQKDKMKTMLYMVKSRAEILLDDYLFDYENKSFTTNEVGSLNQEEKKSIEKYLGGSLITSVNNLKIYDEVSIPNVDIKLYCSWNEEELKNQGIDTKNLAQGDTIIIQYDILNNKVDVASQKGFSKDGNAVHKLSEF